MKLIPKLDIKNMGTGCLHALQYARHAHAEICAGRDVEEHQEQIQTAFKMIETVATYATVIEEKNESLNKEVDEQAILLSKLAMHMMSNEDKQEIFDAQQTLMLANSLN